MTTKPWKNSEAKKLLCNDILSAHFYEAQDKKEISMSQPEYAKYNFENFKVNLRLLSRNRKMLKWVKVLLLTT